MAISSFRPTTDGLCEQEPPAKTTPALLRCCEASRSSLAPPPSADPAQQHVAAAGDDDQQRGDAGAQQAEAAAAAAADEAAAARESLRSLLSEHFGDSLGQAVAQAYPGMLAESRRFVPNDLSRLDAAQCARFVAAVRAAAAAKQAQSLPSLVAAAGGDGGRGGHSGLTRRQLAQQSARPKVSLLLHGTRAACLEGILRESHRGRKHLSSALRPPVCPLAGFGKVPPRLPSGASGSTSVACFPGASAVGRAINRVRSAHALGGAPTPPGPPSPLQLHGLAAAAPGPGLRGTAPLIDRRGSSTGALLSSVQEEEEMTSAPGTGGSGGASGPGFLLPASGGNNPQQAGGLSARGAQQHLADPPPPPPPPARGSLFGRAVGGWSSSPALSSLAQVQQQPPAAAQQRPGASACTDQSQMAWFTRSVETARFYSAAREGTGGERRQTVVVYAVLEEAALGDDSRRGLPLAISALLRGAVGEPEVVATGDLAHQVPLGYVEFD